MYYRKKSKKKNSVVKKIILSSLLFIISFFIIFIYYFDNVIFPTVMLVADSEMRAKTLEIINENIVNIYDEKFNYNEIIEITKDNDGKISMLKADTVKLNALASEVSLKSQQQIKEVGTIGIKMPIGYITQNNILSYFGPSIVVKMEPIGRVDIKYNSTFQSAGINQTIHKIYIDVTTNLKIILPLQSREVEVKNEIPVSETIIVGEIPRTALGVDFMKTTE